MDKEQKIIESWTANAPHWIEIIENNGIESRRLVTNQAIIDIVCMDNPATVLDLGCGEGWLSKELQHKGIEITGVDVINELIEKAKQKVTGDFILASYDDIVSAKIEFQKLFDAIVINFALIAKESTENLLASLPRYLAPDGKLFIQTLHPHSRKALNDYTSGWKEGSWDGLGEKFVKPYQWYFRTLEDWLALLGQAGFGRIKVTEVLHPVSANQLSMIFQCAVK